MEAMERKLEVKKRVKKRKNIIIKELEVNEQKRKEVVEKILEIIESKVKIVEFLKNEREFELDMEKKKNKIQFWKMLNVWDVIVLSKTKEREKKIENK
ncbi:hypothetical protein PUN28_020800 [Cardiocondyla obscurior]|uniref:Uncharacterized protein n=1 Tax=Cardiocondyla obscurior TaxID=286306 RepID=A0AAW2E7A4_9HYME